MDIPILVFAGIMVGFIGLTIFFGTKRGRIIDSSSQLKALNKYPERIPEFLERHPERVLAMKKFLDENPEVKEKCTDLYEYLACYKRN